MIPCPLDIALLPGRSRERFERLQTLAIVRDDRIEPL
jgi:hypothetical protein